jgi:glycerol-3-phosphate dehydrogenase
MALRDGAVFRDLESGQEHAVAARAVINATGAFCDAVRQMDDPASTPMIAPSQGVHVVLDRRFLGGDTAIMVPRTRDARVMFAIPWHDHTVVGTTDTPIAEATLEPRPLAEEIDFILETASGYLSEPPERSDILSTFAGIRPLVKAGDVGNTSALSREHTIQISRSGLLTIAGGKWTTYRRMAEDAVNHAATLAGLEERPCVTRELRIHGYHPRPRSSGLCRLREDAALLGSSKGAPTSAPCSTRPCRCGRRRCSGRYAARWRARSTTCWRGGHGRCRSTPGPRCAWRRPSHG